VVEIQEHKDFALVRRSCHYCGKVWILKHQENSIASITQEGIQVVDYGFDYKCPHCGFESTVYTVLQSRTGWKCLKCGKIVPNEHIKPRGDFQLEPTRVITPRSARRRTPSYQRSPRVSRPISEGAISLASIAQELNIEPKKLRSFLRKSNWRKPEEAGSAWLFSPEEAEELKAHFRK